MIDQMPLETQNISEKIPIGIKSIFIILVLIIEFRDMCANFIVTMGVSSYKSNISIDIMVFTKESTNQLSTKLSHFIA